MNPFIAVILICLNTVATEACDETTAADVLSTGVENELSCVMGRQDAVARSALTAEIGRTAYVKTSHRLRKDAVSARRYRAGEARCSAVDTEPARQLSVCVSTPLTTFPGEIG